MTSQNLLADANGPNLRSPQTRTPCGTATLVNGVWVFADDTPSRHPCKESVSRNSKKRRYIFNPYRAQVVLGDNLQNRQGKQPEQEEGEAEEVKKTNETVPGGLAAMHHHGGVATHQQDDEEDDDGVVETAFDNVLTDPVASRQRTPPPPPAPTSVTFFRGPQTALHISSQHQQLPILSQQAPHGAPVDTAVSQHQKPHPTFNIDNEHAQSHNNNNNNWAATTDRSGPLQPKAFLVRFKFSESLFAAPLITVQPDEGTPEGTDSDQEDQDGARFAKKQRMDAASNEAGNAAVQRKKRNAPYEVGDLVVVEGDRGENIGVISEIGACDSVDRLQRLPRLLRHCMNKDRKRYYHARRKDAVASRTAQQYARDLGLPMNILDAEFQIDLQKLTLYYRCYQTAGSDAAMGRSNSNNDAEGSVDFRQLQRSLYKLFRCRIWLVNWDSDPRLQELVKLQVQTPTPAGAPTQKINHSFQVAAASSDSSAAFRVHHSGNPQVTREVDWSHNAPAFISAPQQLPPRPAQYHQYPQPRRDVGGSFTVVGQQHHQQQQNIQPQRQQQQPYARYNQQPSVAIPQPRRSGQQQQQQQYYEQGFQRRHMDPSTGSNTIPAFFSAVDKRY